MATQPPLQPQTSKPAPELHKAGRLLLRLFLMIILPLVVLGVGIKTSMQLIETGPKANRQPKTHNARRVEVRPIEVTSTSALVQAMGVVQPARLITLQPQVGGKILSVSENFVPGGHFSAGAVLLKIDPADYELAIRQYDSALAKAKANLQIELGNQAVARREFELLGKDLTGAEKDLVLRKPQLEIVQAEIASTQSQLDNARLDLKRTTVTAPFNAVITDRSADLGAKVDTGTALATLVGTDEYWVEVSVPVNQLKWIEIPQDDNGEGSAVRIYNEAAWGADVCREGRVIRLDSQLESEGRMARLLVSVDDPLDFQAPAAQRHPLLIDSYVRVEIDGKALGDVAVVDRALLHDGDNIWIMDGNNQLEIRPLDVIYRGKNEVYVKDGLAAGELAVTSDISSVVAGMPLRADDNVPEAMDAETVQNEAMPSENPPAMQVAPEGTPAPATKPEAAKS